MIPNGRIPIWAGLIVLLSLLANGRSIAEGPTSSKLSRVVAGTSVDNPDATRWNSVVLLARPRIASGNVEKLSSSIRNSVSTFVLTILATVEAYSDELTGVSKFRLKELGAGYSMDVSGKLTMVSLEGADELGLRLGFIQRQLLSQNEKQLETAKVVARTSTLTIFDTPAVLLRNAKHQDYTIRHFVWIDSQTGQLATLIWLMQESAGSRECVDESLVLIPQGMKEDRAIHVDGEEFFLGGIPTERAFALEALPPGKPVAWTVEAKRLAARHNYDVESLRELTVALNHALQVLKKSAASQP